MSKIESEKFKEEGNSHFRNNEYLRAIDCYTEAIRLNESAIYYSNRSLCHIRLENFGAALFDGNKSISIDSTYTKAYYRCGMGYLYLFKYKEAIKMFKEVLKINKNEKMAKLRVRQCIKEIKAIQFQKAIHNEDSVPYSEKLDYDEMKNPNNYDGKIIGDDKKITFEWVVDMIQRFKNQKKISKKYVVLILLEALKMFKQIESLFKVDIPINGKITVVGDTHGQYYDTLKLFEINGLPSKDNPYLFNGDYVDRGSFGVENVLTLFVFKVLDPQSIHFTRGNHENRSLNHLMGFENEVKQKYDERIFELFLEVFHWLPLCSVISDKIFVTHGGVGFERRGVTLDEIKKIDRNCPIPEKGLMCALLWSDPQPMNGLGISKRGVSFQFGPDITKDFLETNKLEYIIRSHELKQGGYEWHHDNKLITIFSCPNYCDQARNLGGYMIIENNGKELKKTEKTFFASPHPNVASYMSYYV